MDLLGTIRPALPAREFAALSAWVSTFYPFQREWLLETALFAICNKGRQIGMTHTTAGWAVLRGAFMGETTTIISKGERESLEMLDAVEKHAGVLVALGSVWARGASPRGQWRTGEQSRFASGGRAIALPASSGGRSFSGNVILDEFAYHEGRADKVWDGAAAVALHDFCVRIISTPNGTGNLFHTLWSDPKQSEGYARHLVPIERAIDEGYPVDLKKCWQIAHGDPRVYAQKFQCSFLDGAEQYLATSDITAAIDDDACGQCQGDVYAGLDVGLVNDLSSLVIVRQDAYTGRCHIVDREDWKRTDWTAQQEGIEAAHRRWNFRRLCVDATGLGSVPAELLQKKLGRQRVEPVTFSSHTKEELATTLYQAFADRMVVMRRDRDLVDDLCAIRRIVTTGGAVRYDAERSERGHADRAWALALALYACSSKPARRNERGSAVA